MKSFLEDGPCEVVLYVDDHYRGMFFSWGHLDRYVQGHTVMGQDIRVFDSIESRWLPIYSLAPEPNF